MDIRIADGFVEVNGKPEFILSGEVQYFRLQKETWSLHLDRLIEANCNTISTYIPWNWHEIKKGSFDFSGETHPSRDLISFLKLVEQKGLYFFSKIGPCIHAEFKNGGVPERLFSDYPDIQSINSEGKPTDNYLFYPAISYLHPDYMKEIAVWYQAVIPHLLPYKNIIGWQVDNETSYSMAWFSHAKTDNFTCDYNAHIVKNGIYQEYLADLYNNDISKLNKMYGENNLSFNVVIPPRKEGENRVQENKVFDWIGFKEILPAIFTRNLTEMMYDLGVRGPFFINEPFVSYVSCWKRYLDVCKDDRWTVVMAYTQYQGGVYEDTVNNHISRIEYTKASGTPVVSNVEIQACNAYFVSHRNQNESDYDLLWRSGIGTGINTINYYWFSDGENFEGMRHFTPELLLHSPLDKHANPRPQYEVCKRIGSFLKAHPEIVTTKPVYDIAVAFEHSYAQLAKMDNSRGLERFEIQSSIESGGSGILDILNYIDCRYQLVNFDSSFDTIESDRLLIHCEKFLSAEKQQKALKFAQDGGHLYIVGNVPILDEHMEECTILFDALSIDNTDSIVVGKQLYENVLLKYKEYFFVGLHSLTTYNLIPSDTVTVDIITAEEERVVGFTETYGNGKISVIGFPPRLFFDVTKEMYADYFNTHTEPQLTILKRASHEVEFTTVLNFADKPKEYMFYDKPYSVPNRSGAFFIKNESGVFSCLDDSVK